METFVHAFFIRGPGTVDKSAIEALHRSSESVITHSSGTLTQRGQRVDDCRTGKSSRKMRLLGLMLLLSAAESEAFHMLPQVASFSSFRGHSAASWSSSTTIRDRRAASTQRRSHVMSSTSPGASVSVSETTPALEKSAGGGLPPPPVVAQQAEAEMVAPSTSTVFVAGGSGFVGSEICKQLVSAGCNVVALSRTGAPANGGSWVKSVKWVQGNALNQDLYRSELRKSDTVVSCVGGFGKTDAYMELVNGEANIKLAEAAADAGVNQFVYISVHDYKVPSFVKRVGYFEGKRRTEKVIGDLFGGKGVILRPGFVYGERSVKIPGPNGRERTVKVPLQRVGGPLSRITSTGLFRKIAESGLPLADVAWTQPLSTSEIAKSAVRFCLDGGEYVGGKGKDVGDAVVVKVQDIAEMVA